MRRRDFITLTGSAAFTWPFAARAQQAMPTVGVVTPASPTTTIFGIVFPKLMKEFGWEENKISAHFFGTLKDMSTGFILATAKKCGVGTGTVQRIEREMSGRPFDDVSVAA